MPLLDYTLVLLQKVTSLCISALYPSEAAILSITQLAVWETFFVGDAIHHRSLFLCTGIKDPTAHLITIGICPGAKWWHFMVSRVQSSKWHLAHKKVVPLLDRNIALFQSWLWRSGWIKGPKAAQFQDEFRVKLSILHLLSGNSH